LRGAEMPRKKPGFTYLSIELPDGVLAELRGRADGRGVSLNTLVCILAAEECGLKYAPPTRGRQPLPPRKRPRKT
jgi:hypothetical protein